MPRAALLLLALAPLASGTIIIGLRTADIIVIGSDSKLSHPFRRTGIKDPPTCKAITPGDKIGFYAAGLDRIPGVLSVDRLVQQASLGQKGFDQTIKSVRDALLAKFQTLTRLVSRDGVLVAEVMLKMKNPLEVIAAGFEGDQARLLSFTLDAKLDGKGLPVVSLSEIDECVRSGQWCTHVIGEHNLADPVLEAEPTWTPSIPSRMLFAMQKQSGAENTTVGGPFAIQVIDKLGSRWINGGACVASATEKPATKKK